MHGLDSTRAPLRIGTLLVLLVASGCSPRQPNVLLITLDTVRADHLGCYGHDRPTTPNLDRLAEEGMVFDLAIAQAAVTPVSHASILTGRDPFHHGLRVLHGVEANRLPDEEVTLAEIWSEAGGETAAFVSAYPASAAFGLDQGFQHFDATFEQNDTEDLTSERGIVNTGMAQRRADATTRAVVDWLNARSDPARPFLIWVHYFDVHDNLLRPPRSILKGFKPRSPTRVGALRAMYDAQLFYLDSYIGLLFEHLRELNLWDDTLVVVISDHGEGLGDHNWWTHGILYQEQIRVPLIIRLPRSSRGGRISALVRSIDLMPTILEAAGLDPAVWPAMDGQSLVELMRTGSSAEKRLAYSDSVNLLTYGRPDGAPSDRKNDKLYCLMNERYKLIRHQLEPENSEFYDLRNDPGEEKNLAAETPPEMRELAEQLERLDPFSEIMPGATSTDPEAEEKLRHLGYIE